METTLLQLYMHANIKPMSLLLLRVLCMMDVHVMHVSEHVKLEEYQLFTNHACMLSCYQ